MRRQVRDASRRVPGEGLVDVRAAVDEEDLGPFEQLLECVTAPFEEREGCEAYAQPATSEFNKCYKTFCGT